MHRLVASWLIVMTACSSPGSEPPRNVAPVAGVTIPRTQPLGWIGLAPALTGDSELASYIPTSAAYPLIVTPPLSAVAGTRVSAIGTSGSASSYTVAGGALVPFGCDDNKLEVTTFVGRRPPPGPVWILPLDAPSTWQPQAHAPRVVTSAPDRAHLELGPLGAELTRTSPTTGTLTLTRAGRTVHTQPFERFLIDGAPLEARQLDLSERETPGIPSPIAAWSIVAGGPILVAIHTPSWEGSNLSALLVEDERVRTLDALSTYLYRCAF